MTYFLYLAQVFKWAEKTLSVWRTFDYTMGQTYNLVLLKCKLYLYILIFSYFWSFNQIIKDVANILQNAHTFLCTK